MSYTQRLWLAFGPAGLAVGALAIALVQRSDHESNPGLALVLGLLVGWSFIGAGLVGWSRRPDNSTGRLMVAVGFVIFTGVLTESNNAWVFSLSEVLGSFVIAVFVHLLLAFPNGRLESGRMRLVVGATYAAAFFANLTISLVTPTSAMDCKGCPPNKLLVTDHHDLSVGVMAFWDAVGAVLMILVAVLLFRRWRAGSRPLRRVLRPIFASGGLTLVLLGLGFAVDPASHRIGKALSLLALISFASVPWFFLAGLMRTRLVRGEVGRLMADIPETGGPEELRAALRRALRDPTLDLYRWVPEREVYVNVEGDAWERDERTITHVDLEGERLGAVVHDPSLLQEPELLGAAIGSARVGLKQRRLQADLEERLVELERERDFVRTVVDSQPPLVCVLDYEGRVRRINAAVVDLCCRTGDPDVHERLFWEVFLPEEDHGTAERAVAAAREGEFGVEHETGWLAAGGERHTIAWTMTSIVNAKGEPRILLTGMDVTDRKREEKRTLALLDALPDMMFRIRRDGAYVDYHVHESHELLVPEVIGLTVGERLPPAVAERTMAAARRALDEGGVQTFEYDLELRGENRSYESRVVASGEDEVVCIVREITERRRQEAELRRSRARIFEATAAERRRLERNLHDGAQQRLVSLSIALRLAQAKLASDPEGASELLAGATSELTQALEELRELARGIHPAILSDRGLSAALEALAGRAPLPVELAELPAERLPEPVEAAAYYVVAEGLTNVAKYAQASAVTVRVAQRNGTAFVEIADDGVGGADPKGGTGLRGLADRVEALDGRLQVESAPGSGTTLRAEIPCG